VALSIIVFLLNKADLCAVYLHCTYQQVSGCVCLCVSMSSCVCLCVCVYLYVCTQVLSRQTFILFFPEFYVIVFLKFSFT